MSYQGGRLGLVLPGLVAVFQALVVVLDSLLLGTRLLSLFRRSLCGKRLIGQSAEQENERSKCSDHGMLAPYEKPLPVAKIGRGKIRLELGFAPVGGQSSRCP